MMVFKQVGVMRMLEGGEERGDFCWHLEEGCFVAFSSEFLLLDSEELWTWTIMWDMIK